MCKLALPSAAGGMKQKLPRYVRCRFLVKTAVGGVSNRVSTSPLVRLRGESILDRARKKSLGACVQYAALQLQLDQERYP
ncbi:MAG: hypothetical protein ACI9A2_000677 [Halioglobus sp.]|jgi:hypothetical protein